MAQLNGADCLARARRGIDWLLTHQHLNGEWKPLASQPVDAFYKGAWSLALAGEAAAAERMLGSVKARLLQPDGDFLPREHPWHNSVHYLYANSYFIIGAHRLGRYDVSRPALAFMLTQQDARHGGFYSARSEAGTTARCDTMSTGIAGIACAAAGDFAAAERAAANLERMIDLQPEPESRFYVTQDPAGDLATVFPPDEAFWRVIDAGTPDQCWYAVGLPFCLGVTMWEATGDPRFRRLADWYFDFQARCVNPWDGGSSGKAGWGCSMLYRITGEERYREIALRVAGNIAGWQHASGAWFLGARTSYGADGSPTPTPSDFDVVAEFSLWLQLIGENLLARG